MTLDPRDTTMSEQSLRRIAAALERLADHFAPKPDSETTSVATVTNLFEDPA